MARIRYLKPGFFKDEDIAELDPWTRLLYAGLWSMADKEGRLEDRPKRIKIEVFPYDQVDVEEGLRTLARPKFGKRPPFIWRYEVDGEGYIEIVAWHEHQRPHHTERPSVIPKYKPGLKLRQETVNTPLNNGYAPKILGRNGNGDGNGDGKKNPAKNAATFEQPVDNSRQVDLQDITIAGQTESVKHKIYNQVLALFQERGWKTDPEYLKNVFRNIVQEMDGYNPKEFFPYFRKVANNHVNRNAELYAADARIQRGKEHKIGLTVAGVSI